MTQPPVPYIILVYFFYGLAFFSMGLLVAMEGGRARDDRLRKALRPLAGFGLLHGTHEWLEAFAQLAAQTGQVEPPIIRAIRLTLLVLSFVLLAAFGIYLLASTPTAQRLILLVPLGLETLWVFGLISLYGRFPTDQIWVIADVWTRYTLAIPGSLLAAVGLIAQQRAFRRSGLVRFGQDSLWAAVAFGWYGLVGQLFTAASPLPPSTIINQDLFLQIFGFPVQLFRAVTAILASLFVIRFLRAFQVETERKIAELQEERLRQTQEREALRGELFRRVVAAQESERQRIARDLHDETGQALTAIGMALRGLTTRLQRTPNKPAQETLQYLQGLTEQSLSGLQHLIADLRPSHLDDLGLSAAIRWYTNQIQEHNHLKIKVETSGEERPIPAPVKIAMFRILQEAVNNIIKHAEATEVLVNLQYAGDGMHARVRDDGRGFDLDGIRQRQSSHPSLGLVGMQERAALLGGTVTISSSPGQGTLLEVWIPFHQEQMEAFPDENPPDAGG